MKGVKIMTEKKEFYELVGARSLRIDSFFDGTKADKTLNHIDRILLAVYAQGYNDARNDAKEGAAVDVEG